MPIHSRLRSRESRGAALSLHESVAALCPSARRLERVVSRVKPELAGLSSSTVVPRRLFDHARGGLERPARRRSSPARSRSDLLRMSSSFTSGGGGPTAPRSTGEYFTSYLCLAIESTSPGSIRFSATRDAVDLHAVAALHVADVPIAAVDGQLAMVGRDVGEPQHDVAALAAADQKALLQQWDRVAAAHGQQVSVHDGLLLCLFLEAFPPGLLREGAWDTIGKRTYRMLI